MTRPEQRRPDRPADQSRDPIAAALRRLRPHRTVAPPADPLARLERDLQEVRTRVNALFFAVLTVGLSDLAGRLLA